MLALASALRPVGSARKTTKPLPQVARSAQRLLAELLHALGKGGDQRTRGETLETFAHSLATRQRLLPEFRAAFAAYQEVRFGGRPLDAERVLVMQRAIARARQLTAPPAAAPVPGRT
jgi:hypothetical protein